MRLSTFSAESAQEVDAPAIWFRFHRNSRTMKHMAPDARELATAEVRWPIGEVVLSQPPDPKELCRVLRNAGALLAACDVESPQRLLLAERARAYLGEAVSGLDWMLRVLAQPVPTSIADAPTERHVAPEIEVPTLRLSRRVDR